jgi:hypothetical protein
MQVPFPELTDLRLISYGELIPGSFLRHGELAVIPYSFLGGSAPHLQYFESFGIPFQGLPKVLSSATHLVSLKLFSIPHSGYISPEAMAALLCDLSSLRTLSLGFRSLQSRPDLETRPLPPSKRSFLPALDEFHFKGVTEYLEEFITRIDTPQLYKMRITFFNQVNFDCPQLARFIDRTPTLRARNKAYLKFDDWSTSVALLAHSSRTLLIEIQCRGLHLQLSSVAQICNSSLHPLFTVEDLYLEYQYTGSVWEQYPIENTLWLQLLLPFTAVKNLYLFKEFAPGIAPALNELVGSRITELLPSLQNIFLERLQPWEPFHVNFAQFVAARQLSDHPITISVWDKYSDVESM